jgi:hypothetical protein
VQNVFTDKQFQNEIDQLSFDTLAKILGDLVHHGNASYVGIKLEQLLDKKEGLQNLASVVRLLDSLMASDHGIEQ